MAAQQGAVGTVYTPENGQQVVPALPNRDRPAATAGNPQALQLDESLRRQPNNQSATQNEARISDRDRLIQERFQMRRLPTDR